MAEDQTFTAVSEIDFGVENLTDKDVESAQSIVDFYKKIGVLLRFQAALTSPQRCCSLVPGGQAVTATTTTKGVPIDVRDLASVSVPPRSSRASASTFDRASSCACSVRADAASRPCSRRWRDS